MLLKFCAKSHTKKTGLHDESLSNGLTLNCEYSAATCIASIIVRFTGVDSIILNTCGTQLKVCGRISKSYIIVVSHGKLLVIFVPAYLYRGCTVCLALKAVALALLYKGTGS